MIPEKIKAIRLLLGITETQVSNIIFMNSYKYKRSEKDIAYLSTENLVLLSLIYKVPLEKILFTEYSVEDIVNDEYLNSLKGLEKEQIEVVLKDNLSSYFVSKRNKTNSTTVDLIIKNERKIFRENLKRLRESRELDVPQMAELLGIDTVEYSRLENSSSLPKPYQLMEFIKKLEIQLTDLIMLTK